MPLFRSALFTENRISVAICSVDYAVDVRPSVRRSYEPWFISSICLYLRPRLTNPTWGGRAHQVPIIRLEDRI